MSTTTEPHQQRVQAVEYFDVLIVGVDRSGQLQPRLSLRDLHKLPKRGAKPKWQHTQDHWAEKDIFPAIDLDGPEFSYS